MTAEESLYDNSTKTLVQQLKLPWSHQRQHGSQLKSTGLSCGDLFPLHMVSSSAMCRAPPQQCVARQAWQAGMWTHPRTTCRVLCNTQPAHCVLPQHTLLQALRHHHLSRNMLNTAPKLTPPSGPTRGLTFWYGSLTPSCTSCNNHLHTLTHTLGGACTTHCMYLTSCNSCGDIACKHTQRQAATGLLRPPNSCTTTQPSCPAAW